MTAILRRSLLGLVLVSVAGLGVASLDGGDAAGRRDAMPAPAAPPARIAHEPTGTRAKPARVTPERPRFDAAPGDRFRYRVAGRWDARLQPADPDPELGMDVSQAFPSRLVTQVGGTLEVTVVSRTKREYLLHVVLREPVARVDVATSVHHFDRATLEAPVFVRFSSDGRVLAYAFEPEVPEHAQSLLVGVFALSHQFVVRDQVKPWTVVGLRDEVGSLTARFRWADEGRLGGGTLRRSVVAYALPGQEVTRSAAYARLDEGWLRAAEAREHRITTLEGLLTARTDIRLTVEMVERSVTTVDGLSEARDLSWQSGPVASEAAETAAPDGAAERMGAIADPAAALGDALAGLAEMAGTDDLYGQPGFEAWQRLADLARFFPDEVLPTMIDRLTSGELATAAQNWLLSALGKAGGAGSEGAIAILEAIIAADRLSDEVRRSAIIAAFQLGTKVTPAIIEATGELALGSGGADASLAGTATLALGSFAGEERLPSGSRALLDASLEAARELAFERGQPSVYFQALRNSGRPALVARSFDYLDHADETVRRGAVEALAVLDTTPRAAIELARAARRDESPLVRGAALVSLADLPPTPRSINLLRVVAASDTDAGVRLAAIDALGAHAQNGSWEAHEALAALARSGGEHGNRARQAMAVTSLAP